MASKVHTLSLFPRAILSDIQEQLKFYIGGVKKEAVYGY